MSVVQLNPSIALQCCPKCGGEGMILKLANKWKVRCSKNTTPASICKTEGHTMFTRKDAVQVWNDIK